MIDNRYARHEAFFGKDGQEKIRQTKYVIVGAGGTGSHAAQQLAYLGGVDFGLIDGDRLDETSGNRVVTAYPPDVAAAALKVEVAKRQILAIQPGAKVEVVPTSFLTEAGFAQIRSAGLVIGCMDRDSARLVLNEVCQAYEIPYADIATDIDKDNPREFGGRFHLSVGGERCLFCDDLLDQEAIRRDFETPEQRDTDERIYGVPRSALAGAGPSVVALNGLLVSAALMELMVDLTGLRKANRWLEYRGFWGRLMAVTTAPKAHCPYCKGSLIRGRGRAADVERYIAQLGHEIEDVAK
jgi:hypothetical protein